MTSVNEENEENEEETKGSEEVTSFLEENKVPIIDHSKLIHKAGDRHSTRPRKVFKGTYGKATVFIKEFDVVDEEEDLELFKKEITLLKSLGPKVTLNLLGCTISKYPLVHIVTEFFEHIGLDLQIAKDSLNIEEEKKVAGIKKVIEIYKILEEKKIVHMQLNPFHILINSKLDVRICGFTKAQILNAESEKYKGDVNKLLWRYTAPEVLKDKLVSLKADSYSFGIFLVELFTGHGFLKDIENFSIGTLTSSIEANKSLLDLEQFKGIEAAMPKNIHRLAKQLLKSEPKKRYTAQGLSTVLNDS